MKTIIEQFSEDFYLYAEPYAYSIEDDMWVISEKDFQYLISKAKENEGNEKIKFQLEVLDSINNRHSDSILSQKIRYKIKDLENQLK